MKTHFKNIIGRTLIGILSMFVSFTSIAQESNVWVLSTEEGNEANVDQVMLSITKEDYAAAKELFLNLDKGSKENIDYIDYLEVAITFGLRINKKFTKEEVETLRSIKNSENPCANYAANLLFFWEGIPYNDFYKGNLEVTDSEKGIVNENIQEALEPKASLYPNPASKNVFITIPNYSSQVKITIINLMGVEVGEATSFENSSMGGYNLETSYLSAGTYLVKLVFGDTSETLKLIIE